MVSGVTRKLVKSGNSTAIILPPAILEILGWEIGTGVEIKPDGERLVVEKEKVTRKLFGGLKS